MSNSENEPQLALSAALEALLFASSEPVSPLQLALAMEISGTEIDKGLQDLENILKSRGLRLQRYGGRVQLTSAPEMAVEIERFLGLEATSRLSRAALETLAIVSYQQPITRPYVEDVRGVSSDGVMRSLLSKGLIQEVGRAEGPGRPILYGTTPDFLQYFGLNTLSDLPPLELPDDNGGNEHDQALKG